MIIMYKLIIQQRLGSRALTSSAAMLVLRMRGRRVTGRGVDGAGARNSSYVYEMKVAAS